MTRAADAGEPDVVVVDARGTRCPQPIIELGRATRSSPDGTLVDVLATDPAAEPDVAAWCRMRGHELISSAWSGDSPGRLLRTRVRIRRTPPAAEPPVRA